MDYAVDTKLLRVFMAEAEINTIQKLADTCRISRATASAVFNGKKPSYPLMTKMKEALSLTPEQAGAVFFASKLRVA